MKSQRFSPLFLRSLRNDVPIQSLIEDVLLLPSKHSEGHFSFLCPQCLEFRTAVNPRTNLARCFLCCTNFNTIDISMIVRKLTFTQAVLFLQQRFTIP